MQRYMVASFLTKRSPEVECLTHYDVAVQPLLGGKFPSLQDNAPIALLLTPIELPNCMTDRTNEDN